MSGKIIFIDFDGTLCGSNGIIPVSAMQAIQQTRNAGNKVFLSTGRSMVEIFDWILNIGFDGIIASGGGYIEVDNKTIYQKEFGHQELQNIMKYLNEKHIDYILEGNHGLFASKNCLAHIREVMDDIYFEELLKFDVDLDKVEHIGKIAFLESATPIEDIRKQFENEYQVVQCTVPAFGKESGEIALKDIHKASAIEQVLKYLNIDRTESFAYGDGLNDMEMIEYVQTGIVMEDGHPDLIHIADDTTDSADHDGIYKSFKKHGLI